MVICSRLRATLASVLTGLTVISAMPAVAQQTLSLETADMVMVQGAPSGDEAVNAGPAVVAGRDVVVVTGTRELPAQGDVVEQARELSRVGRYEIRERALARFERPLCPGVAGLRVELAEMMIDRIRATAARLEVQLAEGECSPNLIVAFVDDGGAFLADFEREQPRRFSLISEVERDELLNGDGPVRVWSYVEPLSAEGAPLRRYRGRIEVPDGSGQLDKMFLPTRTDIHSALVLFDRDATIGMTLVQLADYATMRGLSHTRPAAGDEEMGTILALFGDGGDGIAELTDFDVSYLRGLYYGVPNVSARTRFARVGRWVTDPDAMEETQ